MSQTRALVLVAASLLLLRVRFDSDGERAQFLSDEATGELRNFVLRGKSAPTM